VKIKRGTGSGDFFWSIYVDDDSGNTANNFARWYGGSTLARGRIGSTITPDMPLSGPDAWDDLFVKIDTTANTSEFFFNGNSFGAISHGTGPSATAGAIRLERLDRTTAGNDFILFDNLTVGGIDTMPPRLSMTRLGNQLQLSWPATGMGAILQTTADLAVTPVWSGVTNSIVTTNSQSVFTTNILAANGFFRLQKR